MQYQPLSEWLAGAGERLAEAGIEDSAREARLLAAHGLGRNLAWVAANARERIEVEPMNRLLERRAAREPLAYIVGRRQFYGHEFVVTRDVLIPRPETETLVEAGLERAGEGARILDLCTGSGCVAVSLALRRPSLRLVASDSSERALRVAERNARKHRANVTFYKSDLFSGVPDPAGFDLIVCNPPYVEAGADLAPEIREWEPAGALFAGEDGMDIYRRIAAERPQVEILLEIGDGQLGRVSEVFGRGPDKTWPDLSGTVRVVAFAP